MLLLGQKSYQANKMKGISSYKITVKAKCQMQMILVLNEIVLSEASNFFQFICYCVQICRISGNTIQCHLIFA